MGAFEIFSMLLGLMGTVFGTVAQQEANAQNIALNRETREDQQAYATQAAETANATTVHQYNQLYSPAAKVRQIKDAGLSVGLMYGNAQGSGGAAQMAATPSTAAPVVNPILGMGSLMDVVSGALQAAQTEKTQKEGEKVEHEIVEVDAKVREIESQINCNVASEINTRLQNRLAELDIKIKSETADDQIKTIKEMYEQVHQSVEEAKERIKGLQIENKYKDDYLNAELNKLGAEFQKLTQDYFIGLAEEQLKKAQKLLVEAQTDLTNEDKKRIQQLTTQLEQETRIIRQRADRYEDPGMFWLMEKGEGEIGGGISMALGTLNDLADYLKKKWEERKKKKEEEKNKV